MDEVFRAINDPSRRLLLDCLFEKDGQSVGEMSGHLPQMTRFGVMNHLRILEEAGLVATVREGRSKYHYLNPVPIRLIHDRWISKYAETTVGAMSGIKDRLERGETMSKPAHIYKTFISAPAARVWEAIVDGDKTVQYFYGTRVDSTWEIGSPVTYRYESGELAADGEVLAFDPDKRLEITFQARWNDLLVEEGPVRQAWILEETNGMTALTVETYDMAPESRTYEEFTGGLPFIVSGLKTLVETGSSLPDPYMVSTAG